MDQEEEEEISRWEGYVDWRNRAALKGKHGGMVAASFVLVVEIMENLAFLANASNLVIYLSEYIHFSPSRSAVHVTNFMGTAFLLALLGGFLSDAFFATYRIFLFSAAIEFLGSAAEGSRKRASESVQDGRASAKRSNTQTGSRQEGSDSRLADRDLYSLTVERLRAMLKERGLSPKGKKEELVTRMRNATG